MEVEVEVSALAVVRASAMVVEVSAARASAMAAEVSAARASRMVREESAMVQASGMRSRTGMVRRRSRIALVKPWTQPRLALKVMGGYHRFQPGSSRATQHRNLPLKVEESPLQSLL